MAPVGTVQLTNFKKISSMADVRRSEKEELEEVVEGGKENIEDDDDYKGHDGDEISEDFNETDEASSEEKSQQFRSGTLTRRSRRTCRELRSREHMASEGSSETHTHASSETFENEQEGSYSLKVEQSLPIQQNCDLKHENAISLPMKETDFSVVVSESKTLTIKSDSIFSNGIGLRGGPRRHSIHIHSGGYLTLPRMTGLVGLTLPDLKTRRKGETLSPVSALLDLKIFKQDMSSKSSLVKNSSNSSQSPLPNRPSTVSYSFRFRNSINKRRKSIPTIETLFKSIRSLSSPTPVVEEVEEESPTPTLHQDEDRPKLAVGASARHKIFKKQISSSSLPSTYPTSSSNSSSCHSSPVATPQMGRKYSSPLPLPSHHSPEEILEPLNLEEVLLVGQEFLRLSPSAVLDILKVINNYIL